MAQGERYGYYSDNREGWYTREQPEVPRHENYYTYGSQVRTRDYHEVKTPARKRKISGKYMPAHQSNVPAHKSGGALQDTPN